MDAELIDQGAEQRLREPRVNPAPGTDYEKTLIERWRSAVHFGGPAASAQSREYVSYGVIKLSGALAALFWIALQPTGVVEWSGFALFYCLNIFSITLGYHRYFTHKAFETSLPMRYALGILAQCGVFGSLRHWCADHRRHHVHSDKPGDTHSPHVDSRGRPHGGATGIKHAHMAWAYGGTATNLDLYAKGLIGDPVIDFCHKTRWFWFAFSVAIVPALWGYGWGGADAVLGTVLIAGFLRLTLATHAIFAINSFGHCYGYQNYDTGDQSRNNLFLGYVTLGEGWHNNHHAHPRAAINGVRPHEIDPSGWVILAMEKLGLVWNVQRPDVTSDLIKRPSAGGGA